MVSKFSVFMLFALFMIPSLTSAQPNCLTFADKNCDQEVNISEVTEYIKIWYRCSSCVPDIGDAMNAYFGIYDVCPDIPGCDLPGGYCDGNTPYICKVNYGDGCLEREDELACLPDTQCRNGICIGSGSLGTNKSISQWGITWEFDKEYEYGKFINGDYWVIGPVTIDRITPELVNKTVIGSETCKLDSIYIHPDFGKLLYLNISNCTETDVIDGYKNLLIGCYLDNEEPGESGLCTYSITTHGSVIDPFPLEQGYDSRAHTHEFQFRPNLTVKTPITITSESSIVSTIGLYERPGISKPYEALETAAVLTILNEAPPADSFRPQYISGEKTIFRLRDVRRELLPDLQPSGDNVDIKDEIFDWTETPNATELAKSFERVWLDQGPSPGDSYRYLRPIKNLLDYSAESAQMLSLAGTLLMLDNEDDEQLLINLIQIGIDYYGIAKIDQCLWKAGDGQGMGRKWPIMFAATMLDNDNMRAMKSICSEEGHVYYYDDPAIVEPGRNGKDYWNFTKLGRVGWTGAKVLFSGDSVRTGRQSRDYEHVHPDNWQDINPLLGGCKGEGYRRCCNSYTFVGQMLVLRLLDRYSQAETMQLYDKSFFDYVDRWMTENNTHEQAIDLENIICDKEPNSTLWNITTRLGDQVRSSFWPFIDAMWAEFRSPGQNAFDVICQDDVCTPPIENSITCPQDCPLCTDDPSVCSEIVCKNARCENQYCVYDINDSKECSDDGYTCTIDESCNEGICKGIPEDTKCNNTYCTGGRCEPDNPGNDDEGCVYDFCESIIIYLGFDDSIQNNGITGVDLDIQVKGKEEYVKGQIDQAMYFNSSNWLTIEHNNVFNNINNMTIAFWARKKNANNGGSVVQKQYTFNIELGSSAFYIELYDKNNGRIDYSDRFYYNNAIQSTQWHHYSMTWDNNTLAFYFDGNEAKTVDLSSFLTEFQENTNPIRIGSQSLYWPVPHNSDIEIDDFRIYKRFLNQEEIRNLAEMGT